MTIRFSSLGEFANFLEKKSSEIDRVCRDEFPKQGAAILRKRATTIFGDANELVPDSPATQAEREALGYTPDQPLVVTGSLRDSVEEFTSDYVGGIGTRDPRMPPLECGFVNPKTGVSTPPRPVFSTALRESLPEIEERVQVELSRILEDVE